MHRRIALAALVAALLLLLALVSPQFYGPGPLLGFAVDLMPRLVLAGGMTVVLLGGQVDVSIGAQLALLGVVLGLVARTGAGMPAAVLACVGVGALVGLWNAWLVTRLRLPAILATLASLALLRGGLRWWSGGAWIQDLPADFQWYGLGQAWGEWALLAAGVACFVALALAIEHTRPGRSVPALGCDAEALRRLGVRPERVTAVLYLLMGATAGLAAALSFPRYPAVEIEAGIGLELEVIASVVLGGTSIHGGRGSFLGSLLGVLLLSLIGSALVYLHVDAAWERAIQGAILLLAVVLDASSERKLARLGLARG